MILLWHGDTPVGICVFGSPAASVRPRSRFFGLTGSRTRLALGALNDNLLLLQRVVLHPTYRGAGVAAAFVRQACGLCDVDWVETLSAMGHANPVFERAGFVRAGVCGGKRADAGRWSAPVYYVFDNRRRGQTATESACL